MGQALIEAALAAGDLDIASALDVDDSAFLAHDAGERFGRTTGVLVGTDIDSAVHAADVLIDFTRPAGTMAHVAACAKHRRAAVIGATGRDASQRAALYAHGKPIPHGY